MLTHDSDVYTGLLPLPPRPIPRPEKPVDPAA
jgi:hypothetical protein